MATNAEKVSPDDELITREEAARRLAVSVGEIRRRQRNGDIKPVKGKTSTKGALLYRSSDVAALRDARAKKLEFTREEASTAFAAFKQGKKPIDIVIECKIPPEVVDMLAIQYSNLDKSLHIPADVLRTINKMDLDGPIPIETPEDLAEVIKVLAEAKCFSCDKHPRHYCRSCADKMVKRAKEEAMENLDEDLIEEGRIDGPGPNS